MKADNSVHPEAAQQADGPELLPCPFCGRYVRAKLATAEAERDAAQQALAEAREAPISPKGHWMAVAVATTSLVIAIASLVLSLLMLP